MFLWFALFGCGGGDACDQQVDATSTCYDAFCAAEGAGTAFCGCWADGMDLAVDDCACTPLDLEGACAEDEPPAVDCEALTASIANLCPAA